MEPIKVPLPLEQLQALLALMMCSDPFPEGVDRASVEAFLNTAAQAIGCEDWVDAYHQIV